MKIIRRMRSEYEYRPEPKGAERYDRPSGRNARTIDCQSGQCPRLLCLGLGTRQRRTIMARCQA